MRPRLALILAAAVTLTLALAACSPTVEIEPTNEATAPAAQPSGSPAATSGDATGRTESALAAITAAETEASGVAYEIDDTDDGGWEVQVASDAGVFEVRTALDGTVIESRPDDDDDDDDRRILDAAGITLADAIAAAAGAYTGGAALESVTVDDDAKVWQVEFDDDTDIDVLASDGSIR